jgi:hypothetical protein
MPASSVTEFLYLALQAERLGRSAEARERLRRAIAADPGPATRDARLRLGRPALAAGPDDDEAEAERELEMARSLDQPAGAMRSAATIHGLAPRARHWYYPDSYEPEARASAFRGRSAMHSLARRPGRIHVLAGVI